MRRSNKGSWNKEPLSRDQEKDNIIISSEYFEDERPSFICSIYNQTLNRLTDSSMQNTSFWCRNCSAEFDPESDNVRRETKLSVPDRNTETLAATTPGIDYLNKSVEINHTPEPKGTFKVLQQKGIKIKDYKETDGAGRTIS